jgi:hypothetical protein
VPHRCLYLHKLTVTQRVPQPYSRQFDSLLVSTPPKNSARHTTWKSIVYPWRTQGLGHARTSGIGTVVARALAQDDLHGKLRHAYMTLTTVVIFLVRLNFWPSMTRRPPANKRLDSFLPVTLGISFVRLGVIFTRIMG